MVAATTDTVLSTRPHHRWILCSSKSPQEVGSLVIPISQSQSQRGKATFPRTHSSAGSLLLQAQHSQTFPLAIAAVLPVLLCVS